MLHLGQKNRSLGPAYTLKGLLEEYHGELLERAENTRGTLVQLQEKLIGILPDSKKLLPANLEQLTAVDAQINLQAYITQYALFTYAHEIFQQIEGLCRELAKVCNIQDKDTEDVKAEHIKVLLEAIDNIPYDELINDKVTGLLRLKSITDTSRQSNVMDLNSWPVFGEWQFSDIMRGIIGGRWLEDDLLLQSAINSPTPDSTTIGELLDNDTMVRIY